MTKRIAIGGILVLAFLLGFLWWSRTRQPVEPLYQGKPLTYWVQCLYDGTNGTAGRNALKAMGPSAAQYFLDSVNTSPGDTLLRKTYRAIWEGLPQGLRRHTPSPSLPERTWVQDITGRLILIGPEAHATILAGCAHKNPKVRFTAVQATPYLGRWRAQAIPVVAGLLTDPDPDVREKAVAALARNRTENKSAALSALLKVIRSNPPLLAEHSLAAAAGVLGEIGPEAREAAPSLRAFIQRSNTLLRVESGLALWKINRDPTALQCLVDEIRNPTQERDILWNMIPAIGAMGPAAQPFVPALQEKLEAVSGTNSPPWIATAIRIALRRITVTNPPGPTVKPLR